jgi:MFS family permease
VSWLPLVIIMLAQIQMAFNVNALPVSIGPIVEELETPSTSIATALVVYSLFVAGFVMLGAKIGKLFGERRVFQVSALAHGAAMALMALSTDADMMNNAQAIAGLAAAALVPTLVVLIAANYSGAKKAQALGILAGTPAMAGAAAFFLAGFLATNVSWRVSFGALAVVSVVVFFLSFKLKPIPRQPGIKIDLVGAVLIALAVIMISLGFNNLNSWGLVLARANAPFSVLGLSPAPFMIILGIVFGQAFFSWSKKRQADDKSPLFALEVLDSREERATTFALLIISGLGPAVNFLIPLYIQIVQGRTSFQTAVALVPYTVAIFTAAALSVRLYKRLSPRWISTIAFVVVALGLVMLALTINNEWGTPLVILSLVVLGIGEGALITLVFNVLVASSPKELAGDVGALRGVANNLSTAIGTAVASVIAVTLLSLFITSSLADNTDFPPSLQRQINFDNVDFVSNDQLQEVLSATSATPEQIAEGVRINEEARLRALRGAFLILAGVALLAVIPSQGLPADKKDDVAA